MAYSKRFYEHMPIYARLADQPQGVLQHICDAVQPEFDLTFRLLQQQEFLYDPQLCPAGWLDWLQQLVGGGPINGHWLGLALNPDWPEFWKRYVLSQMFAYWQIKGTESGVRKAVDLWLGWGNEKAFSKRLCIVSPFGKRPTDHPPNWWHWDTPYDAHLNQAYQERQHLGSGDNFGQTTQPDWVHLQADREYWDYYEPWNTHVLEQATGEVLADRKSNLGPWNPWMHFRLTGRDWNLIFPDVFELNLEAWEAGTDPTVWGWMNVPVANPLILQENPIQPRFEDVTEFDVDGVHYAQDWWPYQPKPSSTHKESVEIDVVFNGYQGWQFGDSWWGGIGGSQISPENRQRTVVTEIEGTAHSALWADDWYSATFIDRTVVQEQYSGNFRHSANWYGLWNTGDAWFYPPGAAPHEVSVVTGKTGTDFYHTNHQVTRKVEVDSGQSTLTPKYWGTLWCAPYREFKETVTQTVNDPPSACLPGLATEVVTGYEDRVVPGLPGTPPNQYLTEMPGYAETIEVEPADAGILPGFQWGYWWLTIASDYFTLAIEWPSPAIDWGELHGVPSLTLETAPLPVLSIAVPEGRIDVQIGVALQTFHMPSPVSELTYDTLSLQPLQGWVIDTSAIGAIETFVIEQPEQEAALVRQVNRNDAYLLPAFDSWQKQSRSAVTQTITHPAGYTLEKPIKIATYDEGFNEGWPWYGQSVPAEPSTLEKVPLTKVVRLCNLSRAWSMHLITYLKRYKRLIPEERGLTPFDFFPILATVSDYHHWRCVVETPEGLFVLKPSAMFWTDAVYGAGTLAKRSQTVSLNDRTLNLYMEFLITPIDTTTIRSVTLLLQDEVFRCEAFLEPLAFDKKGYFGFRYTIPFRFPNGAETFEDYLAINKFSGHLEREERVLETADLDALPPIGDDAVLDDDEFLPQVASTSNLATLLENLDSKVEDLLGQIKTFKLAGDLNYLWEATEPTTYAVIPIPESFRAAQKVPVPALINSLTGIPFTGDIQYGSDLITVRLSEPTLFKVTLS